MTVTLLPYDFFRGARYFLYIFFVVVPPASQAWAGDGDIPSASDRGRLDAVERALTQERGAQQELDAETRALSGEITELRKELVFAARSAQESENALSEVEATLDQLNANVSHLRSELLERRRQITSTLAALERVALQPPESVIFQPGTAQNAVRSALLLRAVVPPLEARSRSLGKDLSAFAELRREIATRHDELLNTTHELEDNRVRLDGLLRRKSLLHKRVERDSRQTAARMRKLAAEASSLRDLLSRLEEGGASGQGDEVRAQAEESEDTEIAAVFSPLQRTLLPSGIPFSRARGKIMFPVRGRLVTRYGESSSTAGLAARGLTLATRKEARVVAPYDGEVVFTGPFRGYGKILIIAHGEGYHLLLAGLSRIDSAVGQVLLAGEPVGVMGHPENSEPNLYMELHHKGEPINPLPWLAANRKKVSS